MRSLCHTVYAAALLVASINSAVLAQSPNTLPNTTAPIAKAGAIALLMADPRMKTPVELRVKWKRLDEIIASIRQETGIALQVESGIGGRRLNLFTSKMTAEQAVASIVREMGLTCTTSSTASGEQPNYTLSLSEERRQKEEWWKSASEQRKKERYADYRRRMQEAMQKEIDASRQSKKPGIGLLLSTLSPEELQRIAGVSQEGPPLISASNQSHLHNFMMFARPYKDLPEDVRRALPAMLGRPEYAEGNIKTGAGSLAELEHCQIGLIAANGSVRLGLYNPAEGDVWASSYDDTNTPTPSNEDILNDFNPQVVEMLNSPKLVSGLPRGIGEKRIRFSKEVDRRHLASLLEVVAQKVSLSFVAQDYFRTRSVTPFIAQHLVPATEEFTLREALLQIARAFGHRMVFQDSVLYVTTLTPGADLRAEPPPTIFDYLNRLEQKKEAISPESYLKLTALSRSQLKNIVQGMNGYRTEIRSMLYNVLQVHSILHPYGKLSSEQRQQAESEEGLYIPDLEKQTELEFRALAGRGLPASATGLFPEDAKYGPKRLYVRRQRTKDNKAETVALAITSERVPVRLSSYRILIPLPEPSTP